MMHPGAQTVYGANADNYDRVVANANAFIRTLLDIRKLPERKEKT